MIIVESKLARHITEVREGRGWSQRELGRRAGISGAAISKLESGATEPTNDTIVKVARALGESPEDLLRLAGHLPDAPPPTDLDSTVGDIFRSLPDTQRNAVAVLLSGLVGKGGPPQTPAPSWPVQAAPDESLLPVDDRMQQHILAICDVLLPLVDEPTHAYLMDRLNIVREQWKRERERLDQERHPDPESRSDRST